MRTAFVQTLIAAALIGGSISPLTAAPDIKGTYHSVKDIREIQKLKPGDKYALVCDMCHAVTVGEIKSQEDMDALCHDGGKVHCGSCKRRAFIKTTNPSGKFGISGARISYVNADGEECMHLVPLR